MKLLALESCNVTYGKAQALHSVSVEVAQGEVVSLIGRNGAGKSTILKTIIGLKQPVSGRRVWKGDDVTARLPNQLGRLGIGYVPEDRRIFDNLTVHENLRIATVMGRTGAWTETRIFEMFPVLLDRASQAGNTLSGGEQQMLAISRALLTNPELLLLDEPTEGLAPLIVDELVDSMRRINEEGMTLLLVEQNLRVPMKLAHRQYVVDNGTVQWSGTTADLLANREEIEKLISV
ncbi:ABC transporter ATP-binding protein [uncultured Thalassospira sp.]|uniref:ABC transporter ATP-binding protein n=1 Tax=uncultured Thalassospira sp. TaxID=404382 RepID=UPI0030D9C253|tara:strand:+ start:333 stop:1034 length:702 start_codon:yes stop_codon:yes gene_type:complete